MLGVLLLAGGCAQQAPASRETAATCRPEAPLPPGRAAGVSEDRSELDRAIALITDRGYDEAAGVLTNVLAGLAGHDSHPHVPEASFWLGYCREKTRQIEPARALYTLVKDRYPASDYARLAQQRLETL